MIDQQIEQWFTSFAPADYPWLWDVFFSVVLLLIVNFAVRILFSRLRRQFAKTANLWDDALLEAAHPPARILVWVIGLGWVLNILQNQSDAEIFDVFEPVHDVAVIALLAWFVVRIVSQVEKRMMLPEYVSEPVDETTVMAIGKLLRTAVIITAGLVVLQTLGYSISGVLAFGGIGGIAVGFAAKDLLSNFFGGLMVYLDRPFAVGDWIRSPDKSIEGVVEVIGWRQTRIRTFDKRPLYVPNATFTQIAVENPSRMLNRRIYETIGVRYDDAKLIEDIVSDVRDMLASDDDIDQQQTLMVNFVSFGPSSLDFFVYAFTKTTDWATFHTIKQRIMLSILSIIHRHGADVAYPTRTLKLDEAIQFAGVSPDSATVEKSRAQ